MSRVFGRAIAGKVYLRHDTASQSQEKVAPQVDSWYLRVSKAAVPQMARRIQFKLGALVH